MKLLTKVIAVFDRVIDIVAILAAVGIVFMMLVVSAEVVMRYFFGRPLIWVMEVTEGTLLYITFLVAVWVLRREQHTKMDIVLTRLSPISQDVLNIITSIISAFICLLLTWYGARVTWQHLVGGIFTETAMEFPMAPLLVIIPVGSFLLFIQFLRRTYSYLSAGERHEIKSKVVDEL